MNKINQYIIALTNLYGMVQKNKVVEIYNSQNKDPISIQDIATYFKSSSTELEESFAETYQDYFVHEAIMENDEFEIMLAKKADKAHYIPSKEELLRYTNNYYFERNKEYIGLLHYLKDNFFKGDMEQAENVCEDIQGFCQYFFDIQYILNSLNNHGIEFQDENQVNEVVEKIILLSNNTRLWENNGFTPNEIAKQYERPIIRRVKIGRNDPCPCGSGKKHKRCCLGK